MESNIGVQHVFKDGWRDQKSLKNLWLVESVIRIDLISFIIRIPIHHFNAVPFQKFKLPKKSTQGYRYIQIIPISGNLNV